MFEQIQDGRQSPRWPPYSKWPPKCENWKVVRFQRKLAFRSILILRTTWRHFRTNPRWLSYSKWLPKCEYWKVVWFQQKLAFRSILILRTTCRTNPRWLPKSKMAAIFKMAAKVRKLKSCPNCDKSGHGRGFFCDLLAITISTCYSSSSSSSSGPNFVRRISRRRKDIGQWNLPER